MLHVLPCFSILHLLPTSISSLNCYHVCTTPACLQEPSTPRGGDSPSSHSTPSNLLQLAEGGHIPSHRASTPQAVSPSKVTVAVQGVPAWTGGGGTTLDTEGSCTSPSFPAGQEAAGGAGGAAGTAEAPAAGLLFRTGSQAMRSLHRELESCNTNISHMTRHTKSPSTTCIELTISPGAASALATDQSALRNCVLTTSLEALAAVSSCTHYVLFMSPWAPAPPPAEALALLKAALAAGVRVTLVTQAHDVLQRPSPALWALSQDAMSAITAAWLQRRLFHPAQVLLMMVMLLLSAESGRCYSWCFCCLLLLRYCLRLLCYSCLLLGCCPLLPSCCPCVPGWCDCALAVAGVWWAGAGQSQQYMTAQSQIPWQHFELTDSCTRHKSSCVQAWCASQLQPFLLVLRRLSRSWRTCTTG